MFYEEKTIKNILSCESCNEKLDIPKKLPCGSTICTQCESEIQQLDNQFECKLCSDIHQISIRIRNGTQESVENTFTRRRVKTS